MDSNRGSAANAPSCSVSGGGGARRRLSPDGGVDEQQQQQVVQQQEHNIFGDWNLNMLMMFMLMLHFMQYALRPPCGC
ncbi:hypothetical protein ATCC90586_009815 [Pythium insidiosum]|nr:hypothetical protein ATCC90586_009815 [Pythium insidiosum]